MPTGVECLKLAGDWPEVAGSYSGRLIVVGGGRCVWDDLEAVGPNEADIMCVNDIGIRFPGHIEHWYSNHTEQMRHWITIRNMGASGRTWGPRYTHSVVDAPKAQFADVIWPLPVRGNSGLTAVLVGLALGYQKVTVCGVPLDDSGHYCDPPEGHWLQSEAKGFARPVKWSNFRNEGYERALLGDAQKAYGGRVDFVSGRSREVLHGA